MACHYSRRARCGDQRVCLIRDARFELGQEGAQHGRGARGERKARAPGESADEAHGHEVGLAVIVGDRRHPQARQQRAPALAGRLVGEHEGRVRGLSLGQTARVGRARRYVAAQEAVQEQLDADVGGAARRTARQPGLDQRARGPGAKAAERRIVVKSCVHLQVVALTRRHLRRRHRFGGDAAHPQQIRRHRTQQESRILIHLPRHRQMPEEVHVGSLASGAARSFIRAPPRRSPTGVGSNRC